MRIEHVQTVLTEDELKRLLELTGERTKKDALRKAVEHYLHCPHVGKEKWFDIVEG